MPGQYLDSEPASNMSLDDVMSIQLSDGLESSRDDAIPALAGAGFDIQDDANSDAEADFFSGPVKSAAGIVVPNSTVMGGATNKLDRENEPDQTESSQTPQPNRLEQEINVSPEPRKKAVVRNSDLIGGMESGTKLISNPQDKVDDTELERRGSASTAPFS